MKCFLILLLVFFLNPIYAQSAKDLEIRLAEKIQQLLNTNPDYAKRNREIRALQNQLIQTVIGKVEQDLNWKEFLQKREAALKHQTKLKVQLAEIERKQKSLIQKLYAHPEVIAIRKRMVGK
ncbi:MAG: hypothetical protein MK193_08925 [Lentisphaeria bacterium]|nr:hypothetical protein [Lentisphaeria bacterium]